MKKKQQVDKRLLAETLTVIIVTVLLFLIFNNLKAIIPVIPIIYLLIEKRIRHRSWAEIGFNIKTVLIDIKKNWHFITLAGVISPLLTFYIGKYCITGYIEHVKSRLPMDVKVIIPAIISITIGTFLEEIIFRGFIQGRLQWFIEPVKAIIISSLLFAFMHYSDGSIAIVISDMFGIFIDSILFGIIFTKTKNIFTSWIGHYFSDLIGMICLLFLI
ncbi:CPBP family intramembrane glutamic endopeptidase [Clostridium chromiireducens]|uniref:CAAX amino terminal protease self-immunity n=1 Tax=Clostridium chromiireducens TaxID=225345 RepID=A0A1V4IJL8_9CLOT|nr:type II CAAX endopeptidase family protein [Clostridium chromiireducens]OPJ60191.1 CAAX amino terminal protease self- immunity [Clostridium chromiireducens]RII33685.1 CPBP family intramembrane metalloprotease [Clostridium chromiireducens]